MLLPICSARTAGVLPPPWRQASCHRKAFHARHQGSGPKSTDNLLWEPVVQVILTQRSSCCSTCGR